MKYFTQKPARQFFRWDGRPAYHPKDLLKLYLYGYLNSIRSSRKLEQATKINIEVQWLLKGLSPDHNTNSNFRRDKSLENKDRKENIDKIQSEIEKHNKRKESYKQLEKQKEETGEKQISTSDPESRQMITRNNITEVVFRLQLMQKTIFQ